MSTSYVCFSFSVDVQPTVDLQAVSGGQEESGEGKEDDSVGNLPCESRRLTVACHMERYCCLLFFVAPTCGESEDVKLGEGESEGVTAQDEPMDVTSQTRDEQQVRGWRCVRRGEEEGGEVWGGREEEGGEVWGEREEEGREVWGGREEEGREVWGGREWRSGGRRMARRKRERGDDCDYELFPLAFGP